MGFREMFSRVAGVALVAIWPRPANFADEMVLVPAPGRFAAFDANLDFRFGQTLSPSHGRVAMFGDPLAPTWARYRIESAGLSRFEQRLEYPGDQMALWKWSGPRPERLRPVRPLVARF
jgi:hypothetical protein